MAFKTVSPLYWNDPFHCSLSNFLFSLEKWHPCQQMRGMEHFCHCQPSSMAFMTKCLSSARMMGPRPDPVLSGRVRLGPALKALQFCAFRFLYPFWQTFLGVKNSNSVVCKPGYYQIHARSFKNSRFLHILDFSVRWDQVYTLYTCAHIYTHSIFKNSQIDSDLPAGCASH